MSDLKCSSCGNECKFDSANGYGYVCPCCGNRYSAEELGDSTTESLEIANRKRNEEYDFDGAMRYCKIALEKDPNSYYVNWCAMLAYYKITYIKNDNGKFVPTFLDPDIDPLYNSEYYKKLDKNYSRMADEIENMRMEVVRTAQTLPDYDVFISYRQHVSSNSQIETEEARWAQELYNKLSRQKGDSAVRVFFDKETLKKESVGWEPHIYSALKSAKFMVILGSSAGNIESPWVKNEWKRFLVYKRDADIKGTGDKAFAVVWNGFNINTLSDPALSHYQMIDVSKKDWIDTVMLLINKVCRSNKDVQYLLREAETFIQKNKFGKAKQKYLAVKEIDVKNSAAYWGLLRCRLKAFDDYDIIKRRKKITNMSEFKDAYRYAKGTERLYYDRIKTAQLSHDTTGYESRPNYNIYMQNSKVARFFKTAGIICAVLAVSVLGVFTYLDISNPVKYKVNGDRAILSGSSVYGHFAVDELNVDKYGGKIITEIADGAFKNGGIEKLTVSSSVDKIGAHAFENNKNLTSVTINGSEVSIRSSAFAGCKSLKTVEIVGCTFIGANAFKDCDNLIEIRIGVTDATSIESNAFAGLGDKTVVFVPSTEENVLSRLRRSYPTVKFSEYTKDKIAECIYFIDKLDSDIMVVDDILKADALYNALTLTEKNGITNYDILRGAKAVYDTYAAIEDIGDIALDSGDKIVGAEKLYNDLDPTQRDKIPNYEVLLNARTVYDVIALIDRIGTVTLNSEASIKAAEDAYGKLSYTQQRAIINYDMLVSARNRVDILASERVIGLINDIGGLTVNSGYAISQAESAYNGLTDDQKKAVTNYNTLTDDRAAYTVIRAIYDIGTVRPNSTEAIQSAGSLYIALTADQKSKVSNYSDLTDAEKVFDVVAAISRLGTVYSNSLSDITAAETAYSNLTEAQQRRVGNYGDLTGARAAYTAVMLIDSIGTVTLENGEAVREANRAYNAIVSDQKNRVSNYDVLKNANDVYDCLLAIDKLGTITIGSASAISTAESMYAALSPSLKSFITNRKTLTDARAIYDFMVTVNDFGTVGCGTDTNYSYAVLDRRSMSSVLNNSDTRNAITNITVSELHNFDPDELTAVFPNIASIRYDLSAGTTPSSFEFIPSRLTYRVIGSASTYRIAFGAERGDSLNLEFENFNITNSASVLDTSNVGTTNIRFITACNITGGNNNSAVIRARNLTFDLEANITVNITANNGSSYARGGTGISASLLTVNGTSTSYLNIKGGDGVDGTDGRDGSDGAEGNDVVEGDDRSDAVRAGKNGTDGHNGTSGSGGGDAIAVTGLRINGGNSSFVGGNGGRGGNGGKGGNGGNGLWGKGYNVIFYQVGGYGGNAANGGHGGDGGRGGSAVAINNSNNNSIQVRGGNVVFEVGKSGNGGKGGNGGNGGTGGENNRYDCDGGAHGGNAGSGGNGGDCYAIQTVNDISAMLTRTGGTVTYRIENKNPSVGARGEAGAVGKGGPDIYHSGGNTGASGAPGTPGANGNVLSR